MFKRPVTPLMFAALLFGPSPTHVKAQSNVEAAHDIHHISHFATAHEATNYFGKAGIPIKVLSLDKFKDEHLVLAAYPYSGSDTIDVFCFTKYGDEWALNMLYFHLRPRHRDLRVQESDTQITILCGDDEIVRLTPDRKLNAVTR